MGYYIWINEAGQQVEPNGDGGWEVVDYEHWPDEYPDGTGEVRKVEVQSDGKETQ